MAGFKGKPVNLLRVTGETHDKKTWQNSWQNWSNDQKFYALNYVNWHLLSTLFITFPHFSFFLHPVQPIFGASETAPAGHLHLLPTWNNASTDPVIGDGDGVVSNG